MTITYSLDVASTRFCGFAKLLGRWKGSIYKLLWKEFLVFSLVYIAFSVSYRMYLTEQQKRDFEKVVLYFETFADLIPLSFVLGFYVSLVIGRWWQQFDAIPWPDRLCLMIGSYVHGADERSRVIRRTLGRYLILLQAITFQSVSTAVKKRFPSTHHLVLSGLMTKEERTVYEKLEAPYGKWWLPVQWFSALLMRAKKEGRIKDSILLDSLFRELVNYRSACGTMLGYDWISVPLVYTQVVTIATYTYAIALTVGRQYLDPKRGYDKHKIDLYVPVFTMLQFFFYVGWLKVAEQMVNPYGEDDDDFELNWCLDRNSQIVFLLVDHLQAQHPKLRRDKFWDEMLPLLPHTRNTLRSISNPQLGSAFNFEVDPADAEFLPMDAVLEEDNEANAYFSDSVKRGRNIWNRPSFLTNIFSSNIRQSIRSIKPNSVSDVKGQVNAVLEANVVKRSTSVCSRKSNLLKKFSPSNSRASSVSFHPSSVRHRNKLCDAHLSDTLHDDDENDVTRTASSSDQVTTRLDDSSKHEKLPSKDLNTDVDNMLHMPAIAEESSRISTTVHLNTSTINVSPGQLAEFQNLVSEANKIIEELNRVMKHQSYTADCESKEYNSCCSLDDSDEEDASLGESDDNSDD